MFEANLAVVNEGPPAVEVDFDRGSHSLVFVLGPHRSANPEA